MKIITIKTFIEATKSRIKDELKIKRTCKYSNLSKKEQKGLEELKDREEIVLTES